MTSSMLLYTQSFFWKCAFSDMNECAFMESKLFPFIVEPFIGWIVYNGAKVNNTKISLMLLSMWLSLTNKLKLRIYKYEIEFTIIYSHYSLFLSLWRQSAM